MSLLALKHPKIFTYKVTPRLLVMAIKSLDTYLSDLSLVFPTAHSLNCTCCFVVPVTCTQDPPLVSLHLSFSVFGRLYPKRPLASSLNSFKSLLKYHLLKEDLADYSI